MNFWRSGWLVGAVDAREIDEFTAAGFGIETFHVAPFAFFQRRINKDFDEFSRIEESAGHLSLASER